MDGLERTALRLLLLPGGESDPTLANAVVPMLRPDERIALVHAKGMLLQLFPEHERTPTCVGPPYGRMHARSRSFPSLSEPTK